MRNGHKGRMACGILELMLGVGLILYICLADPTLSSVSRGLSASMGSLAVTSSAAPPRWPLLTAS